MQPPPTNLLLRDVAGLVRVGCPSSRGGLPHSLPTPRQGPCPSPQSPAWLSSPTAGSFLAHLDSWGGRCEK